MRTAAHLLLCLAAACGPVGEPSGPPCEVRAKRLTARLAALADEGPSRVFVPGDVTPIESDRGAHLDQRGPQVIVKRDGTVVFNGEPLGAIETDLRDRLAIEREIRPDVRALYVVADREAPASVLARVLAGIPEGLEPRLVVQGPRRPMLDYDTGLLRTASVKDFAAAVEREGPSQKAVFVAETMERAVGTCAPLMKAFGGVAGLEPDGKMRFMAEAAPRAMLECQCKLADVDLFEYVMAALFDAYSAPVRWVPLPRPPPSARTAADLVGR